MIKERFIELIDKYLSGSATDSEQQLVEEYLTKLEGDSYGVLGNDQEQKLKEAIWQQIQLQTTHEVTPVVQMARPKRKWVRFISIAASIIVVIGLGILLFTNKTPKEQAVAIQNDKQRDSSTLFTVHREVNMTGKQKKIELSDGSLIVLANASEVLYHLPFAARRDITLIGKAFFRVAKNPAKPFTVSTGNITTTAVGTEFTVTAFKNIKQIAVRLYEGKVVVRALDQGDKKLKSDVYLLPGQEFLYNDKTISKVNAFRLNRNTRPEQIISEELSVDNPAIPENTRTSYFMFNNQSLAQVLDDLAALYQVKIIYDKKELENIYFTAKYNRSDSLEPILKRIGTLNNLTIAKKDGGFVISR